MIIIGIKNILFIYSYSYNYTCSYTYSYNTSYYKELFRRILGMKNTNNQFLKYLNIARENPTYYIPLLEAQLNSFINNREMPLAKGIMYETNEGKNAWI